MIFVIIFPAEVTLLPVMFAALYVVLEVYDAHTWSWTRCAYAPRGGRFQSHTSVTRGGGHLRDFGVVQLISVLERPCASQEGGSMLLRREGGFLRRGGGFLRRGGGS